jgi:hypothetical protein
VWVLLELSKTTDDARCATATAALQLQQALQPLHTNEKQLSYGLQLLA